MKNRKVFNTIFLMIVAILLFGCKKQEKQPQGMMNMVPKVNYSEVKNEQAEITFQLPGRVSAFQTAPIVPQVSGIIKKRVFVEGSDVKKGDLLYVIDTSVYETALETAKASLEMAKAKLPALEKQLERYSELIKTKSISQQVYDDTLAALMQLKANIKLYESQIRSAQINLEHCYIKAPISGRIGKSFLTEGATVVAYQPTPLAEIQQIERVFVDVPRSTTELEELKMRLNKGIVKNTGKERYSVRLILDDGSIYPYSGTLQFKDISVDPTTGSVNLRISFPNKEQRLLPGMYVRVILTEGVKPDAILVPQESVLRDHKGDPYVYLVDNESKIAVRPIKIDGSMGNKWLVSDGLKAGDKVVVYGIQFIGPGVPVKAEPLNLVSINNNPMQ